MRTIDETGSAYNSSKRRKLDEPVNKCVFPEDIEQVINHIEQQEVERPHYSTNTIEKDYLLCTSSIAELHRDYVQTHSGARVNYEHYRQAFTSQFNIRFGLPKQDTCDTCDESAINVESKKLK
jgi:hypothetical protein